MIKFCEKCGNMVRKFITGYLNNGCVVEDENGNLYGLCINDHINLLEKSDTVVKYQVNHKEKMDEDTIVLDNEFEKHLKKVFTKNNQE